MSVTSGGTITAFVVADTEQRLLRLFSPEQVAQILEKLELVQGLAVNRHCQQSVTIIFNVSGHMLGVNATDNSPAIVPHKDEK